MLTFILAGGLGTRLRGVLDPSVPKPMAPVAGRPFLVYLLRQLRREGLDRVVLLTGHGADAVERYFGTGASQGLRIEYSPEELPLGTGGALRLAASRFPAPRYLIMNGDTFFDIPISRLAAQHERAATSGAQLTMALARSADAARFGIVELDPDGCVRRFAEKGAQGSGLINAGIYLMERDVPLLAASDRPVSLEREILPQLVGRGLRAMAFDGAFVDIGVPESYRALDAAPESVLASVL